MGRYFKAQPVELNRDFIYQPPLELMAKALLKKDDDIQQQADTMELMRSLPIDFIDYHKEGAANIKNEINSDIDNFAKEIQGKAALDGSLKVKLNAYKNKLQERYSTGDIYNIQETAKNYREFEKKLEDNKNINSALKEKFKQEYWNQYTNENPEGAYKSVYTPGPLIDDPNYIGEFGKWFKELEPYMTAKTRDAIGNKWITLTDNQKRELVLKEGMKNFMESRPDLKDVLIQQGKSSVFKDRNIAFTDNGNIDYTKGFAFYLAKAADEYNYTQTLKDSITHDVNQYNYRQEEWNREDAKESELLKRSYQEANRDVSGNFEESYNQRVRNNEEMRGLFAGLLIDVNGKKIPFSDKILNSMTEEKALDWIDKGLKKNPNSKTLKNTKESILNLMTSQKNKMKATYAPLLNYGVSEKELPVLIEKHNKAIGANFNRLKLNFPVIETVVGNRTITKNYQDITPQSFIGKELMQPNGKKMLVDKVMYVNSSNSMYIDSRTKGVQDINNNDTDITVRFVDKDGNSFDRPAFFNNATGVGVEMYNN